MFPSFSNSFSSRVTLWIISTVFIVMSVITYFIFIKSRNAMTKEAEGRYLGMMANANEKVNGVLESVEVAIINTVPEIKENLHQPDSLYNLVQRILKLNPTIVGTAIAFEPNYYPQKGVYFSPYAYRTASGAIDTLQLGNVDYDYHLMDWYLIPKLLANKLQPGTRTSYKGYWSDPYYDSGGGEMTMTTFSLPIFDSQENVFAVVTADISLTWLKKRMHEIDSINNEELHGDKDTYSFVISRNGSYIVHPDNERIINDTYFSHADETADSTDEQIGYEMIAGNRGCHRFDNEGIISFLFYSPIERTGWSMGIVVPASVMFYDTNLLSRNILGIMAFGLLIVFVVCRTMVKRITKPLTYFAESAGEIAQGNLTADLPHIKSKDEMLLLRNSFERMQRSLVGQMHELEMVTEQKGRIEGELKVASDIQRSMLPKLFPPYPGRNDIFIRGLLMPAKAVGGDLFDFYSRDEKLFFCIGDVSGKGVPASLVMAVTRSLFRTVSAHESAPDRILMRINEVMADQNDSNMFVTLFMGVLDLPTGRMYYSNAGHDAPLLVGAGVGLLPVDANVPVGVMPGWKFTVQETRIDPETLIFLYTDGLTEAENSDHLQFGEERMLEVARAAYQTNNFKPDVFMDGMVNAVHTFVNGAEQSDDLTLLAIQYVRYKHDVRYQRSLTLTNDVQQVPQLSEFVDEVCEAVGFDMSTTMQINLAIEEAVVNVMNYAYPANTVGNVNIEAQATDERLKFIISDSGVPFDPTAKAEVDTTLSAEERGIGGLGIHLVRKIMDSINYERIDGKNVLTLRKTLKDKPAENNA